VPEVKIKQAMEERDRLAGTTLKDVMAERSENVISMVFGVEAVASGNEPVLIDMLLNEGSLATTGARCSVRSGVEMME
jgi:hypothetical protein